MIAFQSTESRHRGRKAFTVSESLVTLALLVGIGALVAELATWSLSERSRSDARLEAVDAAANVLEQARAQAWNDLTPEWAAAQRLPEHLASRWPDGKLSVKIEPEEKRPRLKRVTVEIRWNDRGQPGWPPVAMTGLFAPRATEGKP